MTKAQKRTVTRLAAGAVLLALCAGLSRMTALLGSTAAAVAAYLVPYLIIGGGVLLEAGSNILRGQIFDENFLMCIATVGAFLLGDYNEAVFVMLFFEVGELFESFAVERSRRSISELMDIRPDHANVERGGELVSIDPESVLPGEVISVKAGERIPLDGTIIEGSTTLDLSALTGESLPRPAAVDGEVLSGAVNLSGLIRVRVSRPYGESTVSRILELVESAGDKKAKAENFITRFARVYTPAVVCGAALLALIPPLLFSGDWLKWAERALIFLVVSCPCALVISIPLSFFGGIGGAARKGVLIKGGNYLEAIAKADTVVFDKTGTLTSGSFKVVAVHPELIDEGELLSLAAHAEAYSDHPVALSVREAYGKAPELSRIASSNETAGHGVEAVIDGRRILAGNAAHMRDNGIEPKACHLHGAIIHVAADGVYLGHIIISDALKASSASTIASLKALGVKRTIMLTGDTEESAAAIAAEAKVDEFHASLLPQDKVAFVEALLREKREGSLIFVGDGINDAPVLARSDVGIAMGAIGSDAAIEAADVVLMDDKPTGVPTAVRAARRTLLIVRENIIFALVVKFAVLILAAVGVATMWQATFADVGVMVLAVLNAMRAMRLK